MITNHLTRPLTYAGHLKTWMGRAKARPKKPEEPAWQRNARIDAWKKQQYGWVVHVSGPYPIGYVKQINESFYIIAETTANPNEARKWPFDHAYEVLQGLKRSHNRQGHIEYAGPPHPDEAKAMDPSYDPNHPEECCPNCGARLERGDDGRCNRCGKPWPDNTSAQYKGWRRPGPPHLEQTVDGVTLRLANLGHHMGGRRWHLGVLGDDGKVAWRRDAATRAEVEGHVADVVKEELAERGKAARGPVVLKRWITIGGGAGASGYLQDNPMIIDAYTSHLVGREPSHVKFIRRLLSNRTRRPKSLGHDRRRAKRLANHLRSGVR